MYHRDDLKYSYNNENQQFNPLTIQAQNTEAVKNRANKIINRWQAPFWLWAMVCFPVLLAGQENRENWGIGKDKKATGLYVGFSMQLSAVNDKDAIAIGMSASWLHDHRLGLGGNMVAFFNNSQPNPALGSYYYNSYYLGGVYGGLQAEWIILPRQKYHLSLPLNLGAGGVAYAVDYYLPASYNSYTEDSDGFLYVQPGLEIEVNVTAYFRLSVGGHYRFASPVHLEGYNQQTGERFTLAPNDVMNGPVIGIQVKFGEF